MKVNPLRMFRSIALSLIILTSTNIVYAGDTFVLQKGTVKSTSTKPITQEEQKDLSNILSKISAKKADGSWNDKGKAVSDIEPLNGKIVLPVNKGRISSQYGGRGYGGFNWHQGIDISQNKGSAVVLPVDCKIVAGGLNGNGGAGNYVRAQSVANPSMILRFFHMDGMPNVKGTPITKLIGKTFPAGTQIGIVGSTGYSSGPHLHFQINNNRDKVTGTSGLSDSVPPFPAYLGSSYRTTVKSKITLGSSNNRKENKKVKWHGKTIAEWELK